MEGTEDGVSADKVRVHTLIGQLLQPLVAFPRAKGWFRMIFLLKDPHGAAEGKPWDHFPKRLDGGIGCFRMK